jgi:hypothetical protein
MCGVYDGMGKQCDVCHKKVSTVPIKIAFRNGQDYLMELCPICKEFTKEFFVILCEECGSLELWCKDYYAPKLKIPCDKSILVIMVESCLNCQSNERFYRG